MQRLIRGLASDKVDQRGRQVIRLHLLDEWRDTLIRWRRTLVVGKCIKHSRLPLPKSHRITLVEWNITIDLPKQPLVQQDAHRYHHQQIPAVAAQKGFRLLWVRTPGLRNVGSNT